MTRLDPREWRGSFGPELDSSEEDGAESAEGISIRVRIRRRDLLVQAAAPQRQRLSVARTAARTLEVRREPAPRPQINERD